MVFKKKKRIFFLSLVSMLSCTASPNLDQKQQFVALILAFVGKFLGLDDGVDQWRKRSRRI